MAALTHWPPSFQAREQSRSLAACHHPALIFPLGPLPLPPFSFAQKTSPSPISLLPHSHQRHHFYLSRYPSLSPARSLQRPSRRLTPRHVFYTSCNTIQLLPVRKQRHRCTRILYVHTHTSCPPSPKTQPASLPADRRAQTQHSDFVSGSLSSSSAQSALPDPEAIQEIEGEEQDIDGYFPHPVPERPPPTGDDAILANIQWDEDLTPPAPFTQTRRFESRSTLTLGSSRWPRSSFVQDEDDLPTPRVASGERTPLLLKPSPSQTPLGRRPPVRVHDQAPHIAPLQHRISLASVRSKASLKPATQGHSTFAQTVCIPCLTRVLYERL